MAERVASEIWGKRAIFLGLAVAILFIQIMPLQTTPQTWPAPDVLLALTFAWALRRPECVPALLLAGVWLAFDFMLHRPPGLMAALVLLAAEYLKRQSIQARNEGFVTEFMSVAMAMIAVALAYRFILFVVLVSPPPLGLSAIQLGATFVIYPLVVLLSNVAIGIRAPAPGDGAAGRSGL